MPSERKECFLYDVRSRDLDVIVDTEARLKGARNLLPLFDNYKKIISPSRPRCGVFVLLKDRVSEKILIISDPESRLASWI